jgi:hypothetical protein
MGQTPRYLRISHGQLKALDYGPDDPGARITQSEFRALAWTAANTKARELGWIVKRAARNTRSYLG